MDKQFTVDYFIEKFEKIPEERWTTGVYSKDDGQCALGHCGMNTGIIKYNTEADALWDLVYYNIGLSVVRINDAYEKRYSQRTPKQRILAALRDIKKLSKEPNVQECDATRPIVVPSAWPNKSSSFTNLIPIPSEVMDVKKVKQNVKS